MRRAQPDGRRPAEARTWPRGGTLKRNLYVMANNLFIGVIVAIASECLWSASMIVLGLRLSIIEAFLGVISVAILVALLTWVVSMVMRLQARVTVDIIRQAHLSSESFQLESRLSNAVVKDGLLDIALKLRRLDRESARIRRQTRDSDDPLFVNKERELKLLKNLFWETLLALKKTGALSPSFSEIKKWTDVLDPNF